MTSNEHSIRHREGRPDYINIDPDCKPPTLDRIPVPKPETFEAVNLALRRLLARDNSQARQSSIYPYQPDMSHIPYVHDDGETIIRSDT